MAKEAWNGLYVLAGSVAGRIARNTVLQQTPEEMAKNENNYKYLLFLAGTGFISFFDSKMFGAMVQNFALGAFATALLDYVSDRLQPKVNPGGRSLEEPSKMYNLLKCNNELYVNNQLYVNSSKLYVGANLLDTLEKMSEAEFLTVNCNNSTLSVNKALARI